MENISLDTVFTLILSSLTVFTSLLFCIQVLYIRNFKSTANKSLSLFFFGFAVIQLFQFTYEINLDSLAQNLISIFTPAVLILAPTFYLYLYKLTGNSPTKEEYKNHYIIPTSILVLNILLFLSYNLFVLFDYQNETVKDLIAYCIIGINFSGLIIIFTIQNILYIRKVKVLLSAHKSRISNLFSYEEGINLSWINTFFIGYIIFIILAYITNIEVLSPIDWLFDALVLIYLVFVGFNGNRQIDIYSDVPQVQLSDEIKEEITENKIIKPQSVEEENRINDLKRQVQHLVESEKLFLDQELSLVHIAKRLNSNTKYISEAINKGFNKNFIAFINDYRIEEAKRLLNDTETHYLTIEAIGSTAGFKSKSTFNSAFKKKLGMTPSEFKAR